MFVPIVIILSLAADLEVSTFFAGGVGDDKHFLDEVFLEQFFEAFVLEWVENVVIKINDNSQRDKVENNVDRVISCANNTKVCKHHTNALHCLQHATDVGECKAVELVAVVDGKLHHIETWANLVDAWQMQNCRAYESRKHDENFNITDNDLIVVAVGEKLYKSHYNKREL